MVTMAKEDKILSLDFKSEDKTHPHPEIDK